MNIDSLPFTIPQLIFSVFALITLIPLCYHLFLFLRLALYKTKPQTSSRTHAVSVVICARDEADNLTNNLPGVLIQDYPTTHEVIVVNDNSYDESKYILEAFQKEFRQLQIIELQQEAKMIPGKKFPLAVGVKSTKHEIVLLTDADCMPASEHWIQSMQSTYQDETEIVLGYGAYHRKKGLLNKLIRWETYHTALQYLSYALAGTPYMGVGRNLSYKKTVFYRHKGFSAHNHIPGGDDDLLVNMAANRKNTRINIDPSSFTLSRPAKNWTQWIRQKKRHYSTGKHYKNVHKWMLGTYAFTQFLFFPALTTAFIFCPINWVWIALGTRILIQYPIYAFTLHKLGEKDLIPWIPFMDIWMFIYYLIFAPSVFKKPENSWK
jgi:glycosyltransferase involved in cell wall biosynthesis